MPKPRLALTLLLSLAAVTVSLTDAPAQASPTWSEPAAVSSGVQVFNVAANRRGDEVATWTADSHVMASYRARGGTWESSVMFLPRDPGVDLEPDKTPTPPQVAIDGRGDALVGFDHMAFPYAAYHPADHPGSWQVKNMDTGDSSDTPEVTADGHGTVMMAFHWLDLDDTTGSELFARLHGHRWRHLDWANDYHQFQADDSRSATDGRRTSGRGLFPNHTGMGQALLVSNDEGDEVVAGQGSSGFKAAFRPAGDEWQAAETLPITVASPEAFDLDLDTRGIATLVYVTAGSTPQVMAMTRDATGHWSDPVALSGPLPAPYGVNLATDARGNVAAIWSTDATGSEDTVQLALRPDAQGWQPATQLAGHNAADSSGTNVPPKVVAAGGRFTATYVRDGVLQYRDLVMDTRAPAARVLGLRAQALRPRFRVRWRATDDFAVRGVDVRVRSAHRRHRRLSHWSRWLTDTTRSSKAFRGADGTTYCFSVRAHDAVGNVGHWSEARCTTVPR